ncbi:MAG: ParB/RepB/Spo0J family partition protein [Clostridia bacterium]|nr:ParB/RepB/Spo0J family partition protein [Clostridia bacterium]
MAKKGGLGKGLDAIFHDNARSDESGAVELNINELEPNRAQPRKNFSDEAMRELADSIAQHGVLQPLLVRPLLSGGYQIVAGERRWRASRMAGLMTVPALIRELTDSEVMQLALIENLQREDLSPLEEANGYQSLMDEFGFTQEEISKTVGKSRPAVTNALRLLNLPEEVRSMLERGEMTAGHARTLLSFKDSAALHDAAKRVAKEGISVRELEKLAKKANTEKAEAEKVKTTRRIRYYDEAELALCDALNRVVHVAGSKKKGVLTIEFYGEEDLKNLLHDLKLNED